MEKFEIINSRWIKQRHASQDERAGVQVRGEKSLKLDDISSLTTTVNSGYVLGKNTITLYNVGQHHIELNYDNSEIDQYKRDLAFLEKLLF